MVLSQNDFLVKTFNSVNTMGLTEGAAVAHTQLSGQLIDEGTYCRGFIDDTVNRLNNQKIFYGIKNTIDSGLWTNNLLTYAFSLRAWVRISESPYFGASSISSDLGADSAAIGLFIGFRDYETVSIGSTTPQPKYMLYISREFARNDGLRLRLIKTEKDMSETIYGVRNFGTRTGVTAVQDLATLTSNWQKIRLDIIPTINYWTLRAYTGTGATGSETWTIRHDENIYPGTNADPLVNPSMGFFYQYSRATGMSGDWVGYNCYIDRFVALGEDLTV